MWGCAAEPSDPLIVTFTRNFPLDIRSITAALIGPLAPRVSL